MSTIIRIESRAPARAGMSRQEWLLVLALSALWGGSFFFFKVLVRELPPFTLVLGRVGIASLVLYAVMRFAGQRLPRSARLWRDLLILGLLANAIPFSLIAFGETRISSGLASILNAATPICTVLVAHFTTHDERLGFGKVLGVLFGFLGVIVLVGPSALHGLGGPSLIGQLACLGATVSYGFAGVWGRRFKGIPPLTLATCQVGSASLLLLPLALAVDHPWTLADPSPAAWGALLGISLLSTALAYLTYFRLLATAGAVNSALVTFLLPGVALLLGWAVLHEHVDPRAYLGMALIGLGLAALDGRPLGWLRTRVRATA